MRRRMISGAVAAVLVAGLLAGCGGSGRSAFRAALSRFPAAMAHGGVSYDDTAALTALTGKSWKTGTAGFSTLRGYGSGSLMSYGRLLADTAHLSLFDADYSITVGLPPKTVGVVSGGQASATLAHLRRWGWRQDGDRMVAPTDPSELPADAPASALVFTMAQVRLVGGDLLFGGRDVDLGRIRPAPALRAAPTPAAALPGDTLDEEPRTAALAGCLGDVVAAQLVYRGLPRGVTGVAVGVRRPGAATDTPHAVACVSWSTAAGADRYAGLARTALASGDSARTAEPYAKRLRSASVSVLGGSRHVVAWQADTPGRADLVLQMLAQADLPGLVDCGKLPPAVASRYGCR